MSAALGEWWSCGIAVVLAASLLLGCKGEQVPMGAPSVGSEVESGRLNRQIDADPKLTVYGRVPSFTMLDQDGKDFRSESLSGKVWLATFFFTTCPSTCPVQSREVARLQKIEGPEFVSITVQPEVDTPTVLSKYADQYGADLSRWHFLTGERQAIWELSKKHFFLPVGDAPTLDEMPIFHSSKIILVDGQRQIRGYYETQSRGEMDRLKRELTWLLANLKQQADESQVDDELNRLEEGLNGAFDGASN